MNTVLQNQRHTTSAPRSHIWNPSKAWWIRGWWPTSHEGSRPVFKGSWPTERSGFSSEATP